MGWLSDIAGIASAGVGIAGLFKGNKKPEGYDEILSAARQGQQYQRALADPNDPLFQRLMGEEEDTLRQDFASDVKDMRSQIKRSRARNWGTDIIDRERTDEFFAKKFTTDRETRRARAKDNVRKYLTSAISGNSGVAASFKSLADANSGMNAMNRANTASGFEALFSGMKAVDESDFFSAWKNRTAGQSPLTYDSTDYR